MWNFRPRKLLEIACWWTQSLKTVLDNPWIEVEIMVGSFRMWMFFVLGLARLKFSTVLQGCCCSKSIMKSLLMIQWSCNWQANLRWDIDLEFELQKVLLAVGMAFFGRSGTLSGFSSKIAHFRSLSVFPKMKNSDCSGALADQSQAQSTSFATPTGRCRTLPHCFSNFSLKYVNLNARNSPLPQSLDIETQNLTCRGLVMS